MFNSSYVTSLKTKSLVDQVIEQISNAVINHDLNPGDRLPSEQELVEMFQVGKSSVREAIKVLQAVGVVEVRRGEGTFICKESQEDAFNPTMFQMMIAPSSFEKLLELRTIFEPAYTVLAGKNASEEDYARIESSEAEFERLISEGNQCGVDDLKFHRSVLNATHNPFVIKIGEMILKLLENSVDVGCRSHPEKSIYDHNSILNAMRQKDDELIREAVMRSFDGWAWIVEDKK